MSQEIIKVLQNQPLFTHLTQSELELLATHFQYKKIPNQTILLQTGELANGIYILLSGTVVLLTADNQPLNTISADSNVHKILGETSVMKLAPRKHGLASVSDIEVLFLPIDQYFHACKNHAHLIVKIQRYSVIRFLEQSPFFGELTQDEVLTMAEFVDHASVETGEYLFKQNDPPTAFYILETGHLQATHLDAKKQIQSQFIIKSGDTLGEISVLTNQPHRFSICALRRSSLIKLTMKQFDQLIQERPEILRKISQFAIARTLKILESKGKTYQCRTIVIMPQNQQSFNHAAIITKAIKAHIAPHYKISIMNFNLIEKKFQAGATEHDLLTLVEKLERDHNLIIYLAKHEPNPINAIFLEHAERVLIVAHGESEPAPNDFIKKTVLETSKKFDFICDLVLLYGKKCTAPAHVLNWRKTLEFARIHHVRSGQVSDVKRLIRFINGKAIGLVVGGGGTRAWLALGAYRALHEAGIPIDILGGVSSGSLTAAMIACFNNFDKIYEKALLLEQHAFQDLSLTNYTIPAVAITSAKNITATLQQTFSEQHIETLWKDFFALSYNMSKQKAHLHESGLVWQAVRSSASLPGIYPPMLLDGDMLVDGGCINNIPTEIMRKKLDDQGFLIAIALKAARDPNLHYNFPPVFTNVDYLSYKFKFNHQDYKLPNFFELLISALMGSAAEQNQKSLELADLLIQSEVQDTKLLEQDVSELLIEHGFEAAENVITKWKRENPDYKEDLLL